MLTGSKGNAIAVNVESLSKKYCTGARPTGGYLLKDKIRSIFGYSAAVSQRTGEKDFWALKDVSFSLDKGKRLGIIGSNGAGKSTLLKILSRITTPSEGSVSYYGRIASLLEIGTGFHPELTGRENIFLNGALLGMSRVDIQKRFDEIVDFSGVDEFIDTPVKRYSSGMYVRLAFSVAAHLEPDILVVDEVLAVGDHQFQKKCLGKLEEDNRSSGRTIIFVSHNMTAVAGLCDTVLWLDKGQVFECSQDVSSTVGRYLSSGGEKEFSLSWEGPDERYADPLFTPLKFQLVRSNCGSKDLEDRGLSLENLPLAGDSRVAVLMSGRVEEADERLQLGYAVVDCWGRILFWSTNLNSPNKADNFPVTKGHFTMRSALPVELLKDGVYSLQMVAFTDHSHWICRPSYNCPRLTFSVKRGMALSPWLDDPRPGAIAAGNIWFPVRD